MIKNIDWVEYFLVPVKAVLWEDDYKQRSTKKEEDKYAEIRKRVKRWRKHLIILGKSKELACLLRSPWEIEITIRDINNHDNSDELHFEECTLWDLKENDVFFFEEVLEKNFHEEDIEIIAKICDSAIYTNYISNDYINETFYNRLSRKKAIKILRH